jgi:hypothetical protein
MRGRFALLKRYVRHLDEKPYAWNTLPFALLCSTVRLQKQGTRELEELLPV